jgi:DNA-binding response OmpR family regulator
MASFIIWFLYAIGMVAVSVFTIVGVNYVVEPDEFKELVLRVKGILGRKKED